MFQNIIENEEISEKNIFTEKKIHLKELFGINNIIFYIVSFMASMVSFNGELSPFGLAIFAAACSNKVPAAIVFTVVAIGTAISFGISGLSSFILSALALVILILIFRPYTEKDLRNEKQNLGIFVFLASFAVQAGKMFFSMFLWYDLLLSIVLGVVTYIFYKIFVNSIIVIREYGVKKAFSIEEVMGASLMITVALSAIKDVTIYKFSITNIFSVMLVLFLGWKNGMMVGATSGITIGVVLGIITSNSPILVASYAVSGMIAGILNKLRKNRSDNRILCRKCNINICSKWKYCTNYNNKRNFNFFVRLNINS